MTIVGRWSLSSIVVLLVVACCSGPALARDHVAMPFACTVANGRVNIAPAPEQRYAIIGSHEEQQFTACSPANAGRCRTWMLHRFAIACGGARVPWIEVVGRLLDRREARGFVDAGRLHLPLSGRPLERDTSQCAPRTRARAGGERGALQAPASYIGRECLARELPLRLTHTSMPAGFAPLGLMSARFVEGSSGPPAPAPAPALVEVHPQHPSHPGLVQPSTGARTPPPAGVPAEPAASDGELPWSRKNVAGTSQPAPKLPQPVIPTGRTQTAAATDPGPAPPAPSPVGDPAQRPRTAIGLDLPRLTLPLSAPTIEALPRPAAADSKVKPPAAPAEPEAPPLRSWAVKDAIVLPPLEPKAAPASPAPVVSTERPAEEGWQLALPPRLQAVIETARQRIAAALAEPNAALVAAIGGAGSVTLAGLIAFRRRPQRVPAVRIEPVVGSAVALRPAANVPAPADAHLCARMCETVDGLFHQIAASLDEIKAAPPLRHVLLREVQLVEQRLAAMLAMPADDAEHWRKLRNRLQRILVDLGRLKEIAESASRSLRGERIAGSAPRDRNEAFALLGVNPDVDEKILKKLVEALRQCWHPDLAANENERHQREERVKQINVAWDLISGKRKSA